MKLRKISAFGGLSSYLFSILQFACLLSGMVICNLCYPQPVTLEWVRRYPDTNTFNAGANALALDDSGNVYVTGSAGSSSFSAYCTIKYSSSGKQRWVSFYYGSNYGGRFAKAIALDKFSNVYITGYSNNPASFFDYCTIKYNSNGVQQWVRYYDDPYNGEDEAEQIAVDNAGNIYVSGYSEVSSGGAFAYRTIKYSTDGRELWVRMYSLTTSINYVNGIKIDDSCRVYITGDYATKAVTVKYDSSGNQLWAQEYPGLGIGRTGANSIAIDENKNVYITGFSKGAITYSDFFTIKYSYSGVQQWVRRFNTDSTEYSAYSAHSVVSDNIGNIYVNGVFFPNQAAPMKLCTIKYSSSGNLIWGQKDTGSLESQNTSMDIDKNNNIYITGSCSLPSPYYQNITIIKYDSSGKQQWREIYGNEGGAPRPSCLFINKNFDIFIAARDSARMCTIKYSQPVGIIKNNEEIVGQFKLFQNYPNPFNPFTIIDYQLSINSHVQLIIYDILGREVRTLINEKQNAGSYQIEFDGSNNPSGIYFYRLSTDDFRETKKMVLIK